MIIIEERGGVYKEERKWEKVRDCLDIPLMEISIGEFIGNKLINTLSMESPMKILKPLVTPSITSLVI